VHPRPVVGGIDSNSERQDAFETKRAGDVAIRVLFDDNR
jgi:hypothetical protein